MADTKTKAKAGGNSGAYAVIVEGGGQRKVRAGDEILIDLIEGGEAQPGATVTFDKVLLVSGEGANARVGTPFVTGASVTAEVVEPLVKGEKLVIQYFQPKKASRRRTGHRQKYTSVKVTGIVG